MGDTEELERALGGIVKWAFNVRLASVVFMLLWLPSVEPAERSVLLALLAAVLVTSAAPVLLWRHVAAWMLRHPLWTLVDVLVAMAVLAIAGFDTPFTLIVLLTAIVAGLLYGWVGAVGITLALAGASGGALVLGAAAPMGVADLFGTPTLVLLMALLGGMLRQLLLQQQQTNRRLAESVMAESAGRERTRLAREMHDTLAKTLHGISLTAMAIPDLMREDEAVAAAAATRLAQTAHQAADEARSLIVDLRNDTLEEPLDEVMRDALQRWSLQVDVDVDLVADPCDGVSPSVRYELFCIMREALRNALTHGQARRIEVRLRDGAQDVTLTVVDTGVGFEPPSDLMALSEQRHFGVVGMVERASRVGGTAQLTSAPGVGTTVRVVVPRVAPGERAGQLAEDLPRHVDMSIGGGA